jgi:predicted O-methyltransferase YrrM
MIFFRTFKYLKYTLMAGHRGGHGIHSPFVFDIVTRVFRNKTDAGIVCIIENRRKIMLNDQRQINIEDFGSGSVGRLSNRRKVSQVAKRSPVSLKYGLLLSKLASEFGGKGIIEFGTSLGISTMYLASSSPGSTVYSMEGSSELAEIARENLKSAGIGNCEVFTGEFDSVLPEVLGKCKTPGLVFIDGNHRKEPVLRYFSKIAEVSDSKSVIVIDDINYSPEMAEAWNEIKTAEKVSATIDLDRMGIVFFRERITPKNYIIRY